MARALTLEEASSVCGLLGQLPLVLGRVVVEVLDPRAVRALLSLKPTAACSEDGAVAGGKFGVALALIGQS